MIGDILNFYGQTALPQIFGYWHDAGLLETMSIVSDGVSQGDDGALKRSDESGDYAAVPVSVRPAKKGETLLSGEKVQETGVFVLVFQVNREDENGALERINFDPRIHRFVVAQRDPEPEKLFAPLYHADIAGAIFEVVCRKEN